MVTKRPNDEESNEDAQDGDSGKNNKWQKRSSSPPPPPEPNSASTSPDSDEQELYYCDMCDTCVSFTQKQSLVRHLFTQHLGEKLYKCPCGYKTGWSNAYQKHLMDNHNMSKEEAKDDVEALMSRIKRKKGASEISTFTLTALVGKENLLPQAEDLGTTPDLTQQEATEHSISTGGASTSSSSSPFAMLNLDSSSSSSENESQPELKLEVPPPEIEVETEPQPNKNNNVNEEDTGLISVLAGFLNTVTQEGKLGQVENAVDASGIEMQVEEMKHDPENHVDGNEEENLCTVVSTDQNAIVASFTSDGEKLEGGDEVELNHAETDRNEDNMDTAVATDQNEFADVKYLMQGAQVTKVKKQIEQINFLENIFHFLRKRVPKFFSSDFPECCSRRIEHDVQKNSIDIPVKSKYFSKELQRRVKQRIWG